jgi:hypothetical protein
MMGVSEQRDGAFTYNIWLLTIINDDKNHFHPVGTFDVSSGLRNRRRTSVLMVSEYFHLFRNESNISFHPSDNDRLLFQHHL